MAEVGVILFGLFVLAACCYLLFIVSEPLEKVGGRIGRLLFLPEEVVASTFQALATSGPEIIMAVMVAIPAVAGGMWSVMSSGEGASSGTLNMLFSAMDNLLGIGCVAMVFMIKMKKVEPDAAVPTKPSTTIGLLFYILASGALAYFLLDSKLCPSEAWFLMYVGIAFVAAQFIIPPLLSKFWPDNSADDGEEVDDDELPKLRSEPKKWGCCLFNNALVYTFLVFGLIVLVRECVGATFSMASTGIASVAGVLLMFTSYVSSFPEFMMAFRYTIYNKQTALLGMLFGSNVIDLAFAGFRSIWVGEDLEVYTTGKFPQLLIAYVWTIPIVALLVLLGLLTKRFKWKYSYPLTLFYLFYIVSGFILL